MKQTNSCVSSRIYLPPRNFGYSSFCGFAAQAASVMEGPWPTNSHYTEERAQHHNSGALPVELRADWFPEGRSYCGGRVTPTISVPARLLGILQGDISPSSIPARRARMIAAASVTIRWTSSSTVGMSWISPATRPQDHAPDSMSPCFITRG